MARMALRRLFSIIPILCLVILATFVLFDLAPGDPARNIAGESASDEQVEAVRQRLGLDDAFHARYLGYLGDVLSGDLGNSFTTGRPVWPSIQNSIPVTLSIVVGAMALAIVVSVAAGAFAALRRDSWFDRCMTALASVFLAVPPFVVGMILVIPISLQANLLPATGYVALADDPAEWLRYIILPGIAMALPLAAELIRQIRGSLIDALDLDFMRTHRAKGLSERVVIGRHAAKAAAVPTITVIGLQAGRLLGAAVVVEAVFAMPGVGSLAYTASRSGDFPMLQGIVLISAAVVLVINLLTDLAQSAIDPRLRDADAR